ncbi:hypothetical protein ASD65_15285 [Microbacterium sp. Root61]|uniref:Ig-like domain-containing protein n=1 Tax=Microbacterium sp. Root61 TaxID=1736570 RepID=UPI0006F97D85|nr:Ig-like domain-containing protein [Microbacterium sp. Root61]KRA25627.1 hypothetical protein ASD65_15285 [Microbacterium sp. Root61]
MGRRSLIWGAVAGTAVVASVLAVSVVWPGLDSRSTPPVEASVWALQSGEGRRYARVNTAIGELDTVRSVANPSAIAQTDAGAFLFSESYGKLTPIDEALPANLDDEALRASPSTPPGTVEAAVAGDWVAYRTDSGAVFVGSLSQGESVQVDPDGSSAEDTPEYTADAIAVDEEGTLYSWSQTDGEVLRLRIPTGKVVARDEVADAPQNDVKITAAGGVWFLVDASGAQYWRRGADAPAAVSTVGEPAFAQAQADGDAAYLADEAGLVELPVDGSPARRVVGGQGREFGTPARPTLFRGELYAAWLGPDGGTLWSATDGERPLDYGSSTLGDERRPVFVASSASMILNETRSGWVWSAPEGALLPSSQDWSLDDRTDPQSAPSEEQAVVVLDPRAPVAEADAFGVRAGALAALPVLLNDHDANEDVLSIDPASVTGLDPGFGTLSVTDNGQRLAVHVAADATGTASFSYRVTDGTAVDGLASEPTTVTLTVAADDVNAAPAWCGTDGCLGKWPEPEVAPGGTVSIPVLGAWVDPDGDPLMLLSVVDETGVGAVAATPGGDIVYQHPDASATDAQIVQLRVAVSDTRGAVTTKPLVVRISAQPQLSATSFSMIDTQGDGLTVDVSPHVTGTAGRLSLTAVRVLDDATAEVVAGAGGTSFDFTAAQPGEYRVGWTVSDGSAEASATARITILPSDAPAALGTAPVVAFVHPQQDVTLDVFAAVANPTRRVLLLSDVRPTAADGASMSVDVVGQNFIRVSGSTEDGAPGPLGTIRYVVSDGTDDAGARVEGVATVYLLPPSPELAPIAVDDAVIVRAGAQVDIPVLENDVATAGGTVTLNPASVVSSSGTALAFAAGSTLRYLAPTTPGEYRIDYSVFAAGSPSLADSAGVRVTVISDESNRPPRPGTLEGRVLSGQVTTIPFRDFGVDPDGDTVSLDRIVAQPASGSATISADGESIVYSSVPGFRGQVALTYRVVDGAGATGTATARVGVLDEQSNPSPVTFTDYVQVQVGEQNTVRIRPLANDIDPTGGVLAVADVRPDLVETLADGTPNPEYARQKALIDDVMSGQVVIAAGTDPATMSFLYDVESSSGNTGRGLIVVKVVREAVPDYPVVTDTVLTAETRERFPDGVDVLSGKVSWSGGDVNDLEVSLWGTPEGVTVEGDRISGELPEHSRVVPFAVTGENSAGEEITSYGFLRIPGKADLTLALRAGTTGLEVKERESATVDMAALVGAPRGTRIEVGKDVAASGARPSASCVLESGTSIRYTAGEGAPWVDACIVPVRLTGQTDWTYLSVPVRIKALDPQPELKTASLTVGPGQTVTYDLTTMTTWQLRSDWSSIAYSVEYGGGSFAISADGSILTITGADRAVPGAEEAAVIGVSSHPGVAPARLILRVGAAPSTLPKGGTVVQRCSQASGSSCTFAVAGASGEVNPLPRTPLEVVEVRPTGSCVGVTFAVASASSVTASWTTDAPGATCSATFSVRDAQGRRTNGERDGAVLLDLQGYPKAPAALTQTAYADGSITLRVDPGEARQAYPALTGFTIRQRGQVVASCSSDGTCPAIAAPNGEPRVYEAVAVNDVGSSRGSVVTTAWAYQTPAAPGAITATPVVTNNGEGGVVALQVDGIDVAATGSLEVSSPTGETIQVRVRGDERSVTIPRYRVGSNTATTITVTPISRFTVPPGLDGATSGAARTVTSNGIGAPTGLSLALSSTSAGDGTSTVTAEATATLGGDGATTRYGIVQAGRSCTVAATGSSATFPGLADGDEYTFTVCAESWAGDTQFGRSTTSATVRAVQSGRAPQGWTYVVDPTPSVTPTEARWLIRSPLTSAENPPRNNVAEFRGGPPTDVFDRNPDIQVRYTHKVWGTSTPWANTSAAAGSAPYQVWARWSATTCSGGSDLSLQSDSSNSPSGTKAAITFSPSSLVFYDALGAVLPQTAPGTWTVPVGAVRVAGIGVTVDWSAHGWGLAPASTTFGADCIPNLPPGPGGTP